MKRIHTGKNGKKTEKHKRSSAIFCLDKGTAVTYNKTHFPGIHAVPLTACLTMTISIVISLQVGKSHGREALYSSGLPVHPGRKHHGDISKITFKVYNKHNYNFLLRCLPTSPPTPRIYVPFEVKFPR